MNAKLELCDSISILTPVDRVAARVVCYKGVDFTPNKKLSGKESEFPIKIKPITKQMSSSQGFVDCTGLKIGLLTVIGSSEDSIGWVARCCCGRYVTRRTKAILNKKNKNDRCDHCRHLAFLKRASHFREHGTDLID